MNDKRNSNACKYYLYHSFGGLVGITQIFIAIDTALAVINSTVTAAALYIGGWPGIALTLIYSGVKLQIDQYQNVPPHMDKHWRRYSPSPY
ncbi:MAG: hypothetical protein GQ527_02375 [Bacteroidales bacterium]|nr:hypothetical protein [Bacteroidales bacterium]